MYKTLKSTFPECVLGQLFPFLYKIHRLFSPLNVDNFLLFEKKYIEGLLMKADSSDNSNSNAESHFL